MESFNRSPKVTSGKWGNMYETVKHLFPDISEEIVRWGRYDSISIFIETRAHMTYIFTYRNERDWCFQTKTNYLNSISKPKR